MINISTEIDKVGKDLLVLWFKDEDGEIILSKIFDRLDELLVYEDEMINKHMRSYYGKFVVGALNE